MCAFTMCTCASIMAYFLFPVHFASYFRSTFCSAFHSAFLRSGFHSCPTGRTFSIFSKFTLLLPITKAFCPQSPCLFSLLWLCVKLLHRQTSISVMLVSIQLLICCLQFLLSKQQATNNGYMNTCPELGLQPKGMILQPNSFQAPLIGLPSSDTLRIWEGGYTLS